MNSNKLLNLYCVSFLILGACTSKSQNMAVFISPPLVPAPQSLTPNRQAVPVNPVSAQPSEREPSQAVRSSTNYPGFRLEEHADGSVVVTASSPEQERVNLSFIPMDEGHLGDVFRRVTCENRLLNFQSFRQFLSHRSSVVTPILQQAVSGFKQDIMTLIHNSDLSLFTPTRIRGNAHRSPEYFVQFSRSRIEPLFRSRFCEPDFPLFVGPTPLEAGKIEFSFECVAFETEAVRPLVKLTLQMDPVGSFSMHWNIVQEILPFGSTYLGHVVRPLQRSESDWTFTSPRYLVESAPRVRHLVQVIDGADSPSPLFEVSIDDLENSTSRIDREQLECEMIDPSGHCHFQINR